MLKESRLKLLKLHKLLVDSERESFENLNGKISSGQYLNLLVNDSNFKWLRKFSTLIVEIDEMLDLDDGYTINMIDKHFSQMRDLLDTETKDEDFNKKFKNILLVNSEVAEKRKEIVKLISE
ncbi:MAG: hypothetical protein M3367_13080 [Acidobacteriota bacterium]|nr:hypothetical protein [Acidobacteriota bacterium]